jgi:hypothetical protein
MMNQIKRIFFIFVVFAIGTSLLAPAALAQQSENLGGDQVSTTGLLNPLCPQNQPNCSRSNAEGLLKSIVDWLIKIATSIAVGMILIGAFQMLFSGGNEEKFKLGRKTILYTAIGYAIILIGWGLTSIIRDFLSH